MNGDVKIGAPALVAMKNGRYYVARVAGMDSRTVRLANAGVGMRRSPLLAKAAHPVVLDLRDVRIIVQDGGGGR